ncbi:MAG: TIGR03118 family protein [Planctomycetes bacterium]|nr:TIGR03118 family protein [Planctomycetota bacterium]MBI3847777.1 TIGR03118 family protein [Planctomycetota bacterium]
MRSSLTRRLVLASLSSFLLVAAGFAVRASNVPGPRFAQVNLVADQPGAALNVDSNLVNAWGIVTDIPGLVFVAENETGGGAAYLPSDGDEPPSTLVTTIHVPDPSGTGTGNPTGLVHNRTSSFVIQSGQLSGPSILLFATEDGLICGWNGFVNPNNAIIAVDRSGDHAVYKGLTIVGGANGPVLFAADFHNGHVDMFDDSFTFLGSFTDPTIPSGFAPFNVKALNGRVFVTFAKQLPPDNDDDDSGPGRGFVDEFDREGNRIRRVLSRGPLNSPWGLAIAPPTFGRFAGDLLVGNFGDGRITAVALRNGTVAGQLENAMGDPISIDGLWGLAFVQEVGERENDLRLYFTAGPNDEMNGLFGRLDRVR